ncbi:MAG: ArdC-like ssDNA-binding domain-containing protein, partial [Bryobacteraceae bacterium]
PPHVCCRDERVEDPRWLTYKQATEQGWQIRKDEKGTQI